MEELKILVGMVAELPTMAIWVIIFYFIYKVIIIGSVYVIIKLGIRKLHDILIKKKEADITTNYYYWDEVDRICIADSEAKSITKACLRRVAGKGVIHKSPYIHTASAIWLQEAIDAKEQREAKQQGAP